MDWLQAMVLVLLQGVSELFPVSSLGHLVVLPPLLGWHNIRQDDPTFVAFGVMLHLGTALALLIFFWRDWLVLISAWLKSLTKSVLTPDERSAAHFAWLLVVGTIPAGLIGLLLEKRIEGLFADPKLACIFLMVNGGIMLGAEYLRRRALIGTPVVTAVTNEVSEGGEVGRSLDDLNMVEGGGVGLAQALALLPGISRSGTTIATGLLLKLDHTAAARFSFMLATPIIIAAALLEVPKLFKPEAHGILLMAFVGALVAGVAAYLSVRFLMNFFKTNRLDIFGYYCLAFGAIALILLQFVVK